MNLEIYGTLLATICTSEDTHVFVPNVICDTATKRWIIIRKKEIPIDILSSINYNIIVGTQKVR